MRPVTRRDADARHEAHQIHLKYHSSLFGFTSKFSGHGRRRLYCLKHLVPQPQPRIAITVTLQSSDAFWTSKASPSPLQVMRSTQHRTMHTTPNTVQLTATGYDALEDLP